MKRLVLFIAGGMLIVSGCRKGGINNNDLRDFQQVNLVANNASYNPGLVDPTLQNAWGLAWSPTGIAWVNSQAGHVSELYTANGAIVRPPVAIPSPGDTIGGNPTGIVFNSTKGFKLSDNANASFIFVGADGILSAWNGAAGNRALLVKDNSATSAYTGLTLGNKGGANYLYAADFRAGKIAVWDTTFTAVSMPFQDPGIPMGYAPFNIQSIGSWLYVTYAKIGTGGKEADGAGLGFVDIFNTDGSFVKRFASRGDLNAPWGLTATPVGFLETADVSGGEGKSGSNGSGSTPGGPGNGYGSGSNSSANQSVILVGNLGDGHINVFSTNGEFLGQLQTKNRTIAIQGLWALGFAPTTATTVDPNRLYFTAGPDMGTDGLFGYLIKQ